MPTLSYFLTIFGADDEVLIEIPLTHEQATTIAKSLPNPDTVDPGMAEYPINNVFLGAVEETEISNNKRD